MSSADDQYEQQNDFVGGDVPAGDSKENSYISRTGQRHIPVQKDEMPVEDPIDPVKADSDEYLAQDEREVIDDSNIIGERTRGARPRGTYREPGDDEGMPNDTY
ncbi:hypothetical protein L228DRAFT_271028 [Xylona heveae TC161]|uniref:Histone chaperone domain-containing protein n=1 Tax=Xylona heveae (strain CBS 132557 / TC161) TaxID=1328760 RepID=A0A164ZYL3_XYLHT|nr:hypothetical protein L228DRAFT_271028 [Xylona heveae TC161]KZF19707.1 hypothetical protein L228DRAFT_271028 [Xylona heveae TC161]